VLGLLWRDRVCLLVNQWTYMANSTNGRFCNPARSFSLSPHATPHSNTKNLFSRHAGTRRLLPTRLRCHPRPPHVRLHCYPPCLRRHRHPEAAAPWHQWLPSLDCRSSMLPPAHDTTATGHHPTPPLGRRPLTPQPTAPLRLWCVAPSARSVVPLRTRLVASTLAIGELSGVQQRGVEMRGGKKRKSKKNAKKNPLNQISSWLCLN
jgi:hypothetical protein